MLSSVVRMCKGVSAMHAQWASTEVSLVISRRLSLHSVKQIWTHQDCLWTPNTLCGAGFLLNFTCLLHTLQHNL